MDWRIVSFAPLVMWSLYVVFGSLSINIHGEKVSMSFEAGAMIVAALTILIWGGFSDFKRATFTSMTFATIMGFMSAFGVLIQLYAFRIAPVDKQGVVAMIGGLFPVLAVLFFYLMYVFGIKGGTSLSLKQWAGIALGGISLWLVSGK